MSHHFFSRQSKGLLLLSTVSVMAAAQVVVLMYWVTVLLNINIAIPAAHFLYFYAFIAAAFIAQVVLLSVFRHRLEEPQALSSIAIYALGQLIILALIGLALFKTIIYDYRSQLAWQAFHILCVVMILKDVFWSGWIYLARRAGQLAQQVNPRMAVMIFDTIFICVIVGLIYVPDIEAMVAHIFMGEHFGHMDAFLMAPTWTIISGSMINVDMVSNYCFGLAFIAAFFTKLMGGFNYLNAFTLIVWMTIVYYIAVYIFLRWWLGSVTLAVACWLIGFKAQMFFSLSYPFIFTYPTQTMARSFMDIFCFLCLLGYCRTQKRMFLWAGAFICAMGLWYIISTGFYLAITFMALLMFIYVDQYRRKAPVSWVIVLGFAVVIFTLALYLCTTGAAFFSPIFWANTADYIRIYMLVSAAPFLDLLQYQQFWDLLVGISIPIVYMLTIVTVSVFWWKGRMRWPDLMAVILSVYGLGQLEQYVMLSFGNTYYAKALPFFFVLFFWINKIMQGFTPYYRRLCGCMLAALAAVALLTNHAFISFPNMFNLSRNPLVDPVVARPLVDGNPYFYHKFRGYTPDTRLPVNSLGQNDDGFFTEREFQTHEQLKERYRQLTDLSEDVALIKSLTKHGEKVPLLSSYEVMLLSRADRRSFFNSFPFVDNRPMSMRFLPIDVLFTTQDVAKTLQNLDAHKPPYIFMEKVMLQQQDMPARYERDTPGVMAVLRYIWANYEPDAQGRYLIAMKRKGL